MPNDTAWIEDVTPLWFAEDSNPSIGAGVLRQKFRRRNGATDYQFELVGASDTDFGEGDWLFDVGQTVLSEQGYGWAILPALAFDSSEDRWYSGNARLDFTSDFATGEDVLDPANAYLRVSLDAAPDSFGVTAPSQSGITTGWTGYPEWDTETTPSAINTIQITNGDPETLTVNRPGTYLVTWRAQVQAALAGDILDASLILTSDSGVGSQVYEENITGQTSIYNMAATFQAEAGDVIAAHVDVNTATSDWNLGGLQMFVTRAPGPELAADMSNPFPWGADDRLLIGNMLQALDT